MRYLKIRVGQTPDNHDINVYIQNGIVSDDGDTLSDLWINQSKLYSENRQLLDEILDKYEIILADDEVLYTEIKEGNNAVWRMRMCLHAIYELDERMSER